MKYYSIVMMAFILPLLLATFLLESSWTLDFSIMNLGVLSLHMNIFMDKEAIAFINTVSCIFMMVYIYSFSYLSKEIYLKRFLGILSMFVASMFILILSGNLFSSLIGWDGLGVTSLFLILFYYSKASLKASTLTFMMNRVGDCFFIITLTMILLLGESQIFYTSSKYGWELTLLIILTSISKSAQIPFSTWLPSAMEAPTPVSALVHSSTLVTAGIFLLFRYKEIWINSELKSLLSILSISTCLMAAMSALVESDLKKLIALSTLSQLGFIMFTFSLNLVTPGFIHMLMHAYFKALLFMCAGVVIHSFKGSQSILEISLSGKQNPLIMSMMIYSLLSMMGLPYMAGFYSKDLVLDSIKEQNWSVFIMAVLILSFICTSMYSLRMVWYLSHSSKNWHSMSDSDYGMLAPMLPLAVIACTGGSSVYWLLLSSDMYIDSSKLLILSILLASCLAYWSYDKIHSSEFLEKKWNLNLFNADLSNFMFYTATSYQMSSDLQGIPEILNSVMKKSLFWFTSSMKNTMSVYSGNLELLVYLVILALLV